MGAFLPIIHFHCIGVELVVIIIRDSSHCGRVPAPTHPSFNRRETINIILWSRFDWIWLVLIFVFTDETWSEGCAQELRLSGYGPVR